MVPSSPHDTDDIRAERALLDVCAKWGIDVAGALVLKEMEANGGKATLKDLKADGGVQPSKATRVATALEDAGLIERISPRADRRLVKLYPTEEGWDAIDDLNAALGETTVFNRLAERWKRIELLRARLDVSRAQAACLIALAESDGLLTASQAARKAGLKRTTAAMALAKLEQLRLVESAGPRGNGTAGPTRYALARAARIELARIGVPGEGR